MEIWLAKGYFCKCGNTSWGTDEEGVWFIFLWKQHFQLGFDTVIRLIDSEYFHKVTEQLRWETTSGNHKVFGGLKLYI